MIKPKTLDLEEIISKLDKYSDFRDEGNQVTFRLLVEEFGSWGQPYTINYLLRYLDDFSDHPEILFDIVHVIESYTPVVYAQRLLPMIPSLVEQAPQWTKILHYRIFNQPEYLHAYKEQLRFSLDSTIGGIKALLLAIKSEEPNFTYPCDLLLYIIEKEEIRRLIKREDSESLTTHFKIPFEDTFRKVIVRQVNETPCAIGIVIDKETLNFHFFVNTLKQLESAPSEKWNIWAWRDYETLNDLKLNIPYCGQVSKKLTQKQQMFLITECSLAAIKDLIDRGFFPKNCLYFFAQQGASQAAHTEWVKYLNNTENAKEFEQSLHAEVKACLISKGLI